MSDLREYRFAEAEQESDSRSAIRASVVGFVWLAFYVVALVITIVSPPVSSTVEMASRF